MKVLYDYAKTRYVAVLGLEGGDDEEDTETLRGRIESMIVQGPELFSRALARMVDPGALTQLVSEDRYVWVMDIIDGLVSEMRVGDYTAFESNGEDSYPETRPRFYFEGDDVPEGLSGSWVIAHGGKVEMMSGTNNTSELRKVGYVFWDVERVMHAWGGSRH